MNKTILLILHQEHSTPGRVAHRLIDRGFHLDARRPRFGDPLPETLEQHDGVIVFGGPMSANDSEEYVRQEIDWMEVPLREEKPFFGICLGAQILARKLGANDRFPSRRDSSRSAITRYAPRRKAQNSSTGRTIFISGIARDSSFHTVPCDWPRATPSPTRRFNTVAPRSACSFIPSSRIR